MAQEMGFVMRKLRVCLQIIGGVVVLLFVLGIALGALGRGKSNNVTTTPDAVEEQAEVAPKSDTEGKKEGEEKAKAEKEAPSEPTTAQKLAEALKGAE